MKKIFVYVMTHLGDPNKHGCWGCCNCMGKKRSYNYEAVIGVGGVGATADEFAGQLKWIGIGPDKRPVASERPKVTFDHFLDFDTEDPDIPDIREVAPMLAARIKKAPRGFMNLTSGQQAEAEKLLELAKKAPPSLARAKRGAGHDQIDGKDLCSRSPRDQQ